MPGQPCAAARRAVGLPPEGRGESCRPATARPPATLAAYHRSPAALRSPGCLRQLALPVPAVSVARRRCALEAVEKVVTALPRPAPPVLSRPAPPARPASHEEDDVVNEPIPHSVDHGDMLRGREPGHDDAAAVLLVDYVIPGHDPAGDVRP